MIEIPSYRRVFELERRIYRIDRLRLNPSGVPVRGVVYFLVLVGASVLAGAMPLVAVLAHALPWYVRALILPGTGAGLMAVIRIEGRPFHTAARALLGYRRSPRRLACLVRASSVGTCWLPQDIVLLPDGSDARMRRMSYIGPGAALVTVDHEQLVNRGRATRAKWRHGASPSLTLRTREPRRVLAEGQVLVLRAGVRLFTVGG
jgi:hypothetical protein